MVGNPANANQVRGSAYGLEYLDWLPGSIGLLGRVSPVGLDQFTALLRQSTVASALIGFTWLLYWLNKYKT
jgi:hypothetical protein